MVLWWWFFSCTKSKESQSNIIHKKLSDNVVMVSCLLSWTKQRNMIFNYEFRLMILLLLWANSIFQHSFKSITTWLMVDPICKCEICIRHCYFNHFPNGVHLKIFFQFWIDDGTDITLRNHWVNLLIDMCYLILSLCQNWSY